MHYTGPDMADAIRDNWWALMLLGAFVGAFSGMFGLGGGAVLVPLLVLMLAYDQKTAQGTSLAMILAPTAAPAIWSYHREGFVHWRLVIYVVPTMMVGSYFGAELAKSLPQDLLKVLFAVVLTYVAAYMVFSKLGDVPKALAYSTGPVILMLILIFVSGVFSKVVAKPAEGEPKLAAVED